MVETMRQEVEDIFHSQAGALNDRFTHPHFGITGDSLKRMLVMHHFFSQCHETQSKFFNLYYYYAK